MNYNLTQRALCEADLYTHATVGMGYDYLPEDLRDMCEWMETQYDPCNQVRTNVMVQVMRDSFKSTTLTQSLPSWYLARNPNLSILIVSKKASHAASFLDAQKKRWEQQDFIRMFGTWKGNQKAKWDSEKLYISTRTKHRREASLSCASVGTSLTSQHYDIIIADDITTMEDMYSIAARRETWRFYKSLFDLLDKRRGLLLLIGTCWHEDDIFEKIKKQQKQKAREGVEPYHIYHRPMYDERVEPREYNFSWLNDAFVNQIRMDKADVRDFSANYLLKPVPDDFKIFNLEKLHYYDEEPEMKWLLMFIDPSLKDAKHNDYASICWIGCGVDNKFYVLGFDIEQRKPSKTIAAIGEVYQRLQKQYEGKEIFCYMETVAFQQFLKDQAVNELCTKGIYVPIMNYPQQRNKIERITSVEKYLASGIILLRKNWELLPGYKLAMEQLSAFPMGDHDDGPDSMEGAINIAIQMI